MATRISEHELVIDLDYDKHAATMLHVYARLVERDGRTRQARDLREQARTLKEAKSARP